MFVLMHMHRSLHHRIAGPKLACTRACHQRLADLPGRNEIYGVGWLSH